jgi:uncharacterized protein (DUF1330 family)
MPAYVIAQVEITDREGFAPYHDGVPAVVARHGGRYVVRGGDPEALEGDWEPARLVILEFDDVAAAKRWYESPEYQELVSTRAGSARVSLVVADGVSERPPGT